MRFFWFINEVSGQIDQQKAESDVYGSPGFFDLCVGEQDRRLAPVYAKWRRDLFTLESFSRFVDAHKRPISEITAALNAGKSAEQIAKEDAEEEAKEEKQDQEDRDRDAKFLAEKCPTCTQKCDWYFKNRVLTTPLSLEDSLLSFKVTGLKGAGQI
jgi:hypothetical protein